MEAKERRAQLLNALRQAKEPLTGSTLAREMGVSRQIIVGDIAILRAAGVNIYATPQGYVLPMENVSQPLTGTLACKHSRRQVAQELEIIIDHGGKVRDVIVEHPVYGEIRANLMLSSRRDIADFLAALTNSGAEPISIVTGGVHLHTVEVPSEEVFREIEGALKAAGILIH
ncbi:transcription repressor NadR [Propionispora sp. 2/2-37]|uniref:transcription repressor NadR n=1 Tax=Propionispora sp. 2/2-37 TaxID=1677858 RepID=UPI0006BB5AFD|nr:transcription repressor NadR [Propionispora sp. 2/2-37]